MSRPPPPSRSVLYSFDFVGTALVGSLTMALVCAFAPPAAQLAALGGLISILGGLVLSYVQQEGVRESRRREEFARLAVPLTLAPRPELHAQYVAFCKTLTDLADQTDPILREIAALKLASVNAQIGSLADGTVIFGGTETWRTVYDALLAAPRLREYQSAAWVRSPEYWRDAPGRQSMKANYDAVNRGVLVERIVILRDDLWPKDQLLPSDAILPWLEEQNDSSLRIFLVRESALESEPDLLADFGVYGDRACGVQELDERSRTIRFTLHFDPQAVRLAKDRWKRLAVYAVPFYTLLDRAEKVG